MDTEGGPLPAKRPRTTFNGNVQLTQLTECIREFKLPRQYPSMASKLQSSSNDKNKTRANFNGRVVSLPKGQTINAKIIRQNNTIPVSTIIRKIKLKGKDGRDLGEVNVQHLPQNIKGKTITIAKNSMKLQNNLSIPIKDNVKGVTIGILTPVNLVPTENKSESPRPIVKTQMHTLDKYFHCEKEKERNIRLTEQKKTGNIVFQLGKSWHTVKVSGAKYPDIKAGTITLLGGKMDKVSSDVHPIDNEVNKTVANVQNIGENCQSDKKTSQQPAKNLKMMVTRRISDGVTVQQKSPISRENSEVAKNERPKIEISRIYGPSSIKVLPEAQKSKVPALKRDVMVVLPESMGDLGIDITKTNSSLEVNSKTPSPVETDSPSNAWKKKLLATRNINKEQAKADKEMTSQLSIVQKALSTVEDKELRAKALRALAECGIGIERFVTIREPADQRPVKDSATQTQIFGLWDPDRFINVPNEKPTIERIKIHEKPQLNYNMSHFSDEAFSTLSLDTLDIPKWRRIEAESTCHLADAVAGFLKGNEGAEQVKNIFAQPHGVHPKVKAQLEKDLKTYNQFDDNGLLSIHRAVQDNDINAVARLLKILRLCRESVDIPTRDGQTSLELAVRYEASPKIVTMLLEADAQPTSTEASHDSAVLIASKKSLPILPTLISYVTTRKSLDSFDTSGFTALHHCAQNGNQLGIETLIEASADVNLRDRRSGRTALFHALENDYMKIVQELMGAGAQSNVPNYSGQTVFHLLDDHKHFDLVESLNRANNKHYEETQILP